MVDASGTRDENLAFLRPVEPRYGDRNAVCLGICCMIRCAIDSRVPAWSICFRGDVVEDENLQVGEGGGACFVADEL